MDKRLISRPTVCSTKRDYYTTAKEGTYVAYKLYGGHDIIYYPLIIHYKKLT